MNEHILEVLLSVLVKLEFAMFHFEMHRTTAYRRALN